MLKMNVNNDTATSVTEIITRLQADIEHWTKKLEAAESAVKDASAKRAELVQTLNVLRKYAPAVAETNSPASAALNGGEFEGMSLREGIKIVLRRHGGGPMSTTEIAKWLADGGMKSNAASFRSNVSATLSVMHSKYREVTKTDAGWILSQATLSSSSDAAA